MHLVAAYVNFAIGLSMRSLRLIAARVLASVYSTFEYRRPHATNFLAISPACVFAILLFRPNKIARALRGGIQRVLSWKLRRVTNGHSTRALADSCISVTLPKRTSVIGGHAWKKRLFFPPVCSYQSAHTTTTKPKIASIHFRRFRVRIRRPEIVIYLAPDFPFPFFLFALVSSYCISL
ncbi:hypothetical protein VTK73DRAFT_7050 [Phialemonium thermophilum]|uniref:Uncharacterized protein n=1 Tax=Phialemonium thermophilum TaxID=223376 RepID=A0ABR3WGV8_9PEZI